MTKRFLDDLLNRVIIFDGAMGTILYSKGIFINRCFDELNLSNPKMVAAVHREYLKAGVDAIETNTFGANYYKLLPHGLEDKIYELNYLGAEIARKEAGPQIYVAGSIGPLGLFIEPYGNIRAAEALKTFEEQTRGLIDGGVDLIILETFFDLNEIQVAMTAVKNVIQQKGGDIPIIAQMTFADNVTSSLGILPEIAAKRLEEWGADVVGANCSTGPQPMLENIQRMMTVTNLPLSAQPNAGAPKLIDGRYIFLTTPEYFTEYTKRFITLGVKVVGGCCGTTPQHIQELKNAVKALAPSRIQVEQIPTLDTPVESKAELPTSQKSEFARKLSEKRFVTCVEIVPPRGTDLKGILAKAEKFKEFGADAVNIPDGPRATARMSPMAVALIIKDKVSIEPILHYTCRDRNLLGMQSDMLGVHAIGIRNILVVTGDPPKMGDYPSATAVYDVDSIGLVRIIKKLNHGVDVADKSIGEPTALHIGVGVNPGAINIEEEIRRFKLKVESGAEYALTQPIFDEPTFDQFLARISDLDIPILAGILPISSYKMAEFLHNEIPGMSIPLPIRDQFFNTKSKEAAEALGLELSKKAILHVQNKVRGIYVMTPVGGTKAVQELLAFVKQQGSTR